MEIEWINVGGNGTDTHFPYNPWIQAETSFPDLETAENFLKASFTLSASVNLPELQTAQVTATVNRSSYRGGSVRANVKWNGGNYAVLVSLSDLDAPEVVDVRFFNAQGYELNIDAEFDAETGDFADLTGEALLNGEQVGAVEFREGAPVIVYSNGDEEVFDSLM